MFFFTFWAKTNPLINEVQNLKCRAGWILFFWNSSAHKKYFDKTFEAPFCQVISQSYSLENSPTKMLSRVVYVMNFYLWMLTFVMTILKFVC